MAIINTLVGVTGFAGPIAGGWLFKVMKDGPRWLPEYGYIGICGLAMMCLSVIAPLAFRRLV
jgi:hypothetical protein